MNLNNDLFITKNELLKATTKLNIEIDNNNI
jgi:hypothetical protein